MKHKTHQRISTNSRSLTAKETQNITALSLAGDLLESALSKRLDVMHVLLVQIVDSGLVDGDIYIKGEVAKLSRKVEKLQDTLFSLFPKYNKFTQANLTGMGITSFLCQIDILRKEAYWSINEPVLQSRAEEFIHSLFNLYSDIDVLIAKMDSVQPEWHQSARAHAPQYYSYVTLSV